MIEPRLILIIIFKSIAGIVALYYISKKYRIEYGVSLLIFAAVALTFTGIILAFGISYYAIFLSLPISLGIIHAFGFKSYDNSKVEPFVPVDSDPDDSEDEWVVVKTYMDARAIAEVERDKQILAHHGIANYIKTVGFTNLYVAVTDEDRACEVLDE